jgi:hypothetical protein
MATTVVLAVAGRAHAGGNDFFYPNTAADGLHPGSSCANGSTAPCSLRDAVIKAANDNDGNSSNPSGAGPYPPAAP